VYVFAYPPTVMQLGSEAGESRQDSRPLFPAAATTTIPAPDMDLTAAFKAYGIYKNRGRDRRL
jgi:hypothetical protein